MRRAMAGMGLLAVTAGLAFAGARAAQGGAGAVEAVTASLDVERALLSEDLRRHAEMAAERNQSQARLEEAYAALDAAIGREDGDPAREIETLAQRVWDIERERMDALPLELALVDRIRERRRKISLLEEQIASLQERAVEVGGPLSGRWEVILLPTNHRGSFQLAQDGTLVTGTYVLEGGWTGSLQGTLVNRKVRLERIDSKLGRSASFEGFLSADGERIRGSWTSYDLAAEGGSNGQWSATRQPSAP